MELKTQVAVVGAGHAGVEAALASARMGVDTVLFTMSLDSIANMPCNPSIGGTAKGHLVYEIDALGGEMGRSADLVTLQSRTLNLGKGAAVHSKRVQADRRKYQQIMKSVIEKTPNLRLIQAEIVEIITEESAESPYTKRIVGVKTSLGEIWGCEAAIICGGTFLNGRIFVGDVNYPAGPDGLLDAKRLSNSLIENGIRLMRFKTGTPVRVKKSTIDFSQLEIQEGEKECTPYSWQTDTALFENRTDVPCYIVYTNAQTHKIIRDNIHRSAMYSGQIHGTGPRYCPSIEDKLVRFADKERHQLFVEPVGEDTEEMYIQGFSTSLPTSVQYEMLRSLDGFANAEIMRYAYAIEYDCIDPTQLYATLEFKGVSGLYGAGQFNGTSGYEEAAAQGLIAGMNAALRSKGEDPVVLSRSESYIGTLIDDLTTKGTNEPYRMMTSRSEYRLLLRQDNADERLTPIGRRAGLVSDRQYEKFLAKRNAIAKEKERLETTYISKEKASEFLVNKGQDPAKSGVSLADLIRRPDFDYDQIAELDVDRPILPKDVVLTASTDIKYAGYVKRQLAEVKKYEKIEAKPLPRDLEYLEIKGLRIEAAQKLDKIRPLTVGQASRISGVNPADISVLLIYLGIK
ncbi:MAG: tRNA uridine-5-carboxymethylaminomethyl(34) synthesis enzyme MnmG [Clostridia bacterium]|nr:tRNA uridine-5-carboxymethylaminomethyl(34) synthesis enzyme MnmG [Oscillospiraceae bacterium]MBQ7830163.1 tRNA uridine-5-carboxymethylaminomethyl(34) synthesis enzyme MnmG [Clostridia bacterium]